MITECEELIIMRFELMRNIEIYSTQWTVLKATSHMIINPTFKNYQFKKRG